MAPRRSSRGPLQLEEQPWLRVRNAGTSPTTATPWVLTCLGWELATSPSWKLVQIRGGDPGSEGPWLALSTPGEGLYPALMLQTPSALP